MENKSNKTRKPKQVQKVQKPVEIKVETLTINADLKGALQLVLKAKAEKKEYQITGSVGNQYIVKRAVSRV